MAEVTRKYDVSLEPPPMGDADLREVMECIEAAFEGGGYVLTSADEVAFDTPFENIGHMIEVVRKYGRPR